MIEDIFSRKKNSFLIIISALLIILTFATSYYGHIDTGDYADTGKYFTGEYSAKIRSSHSYLLGFVHSPLINLTQSFISFKITSLIFLFLIIYSIYIITNRNRKALWLSILSPIVWYMAPWINPIQISSFLFLWAYYFMVKYDKEDEKINILYSGILVGLGWAFWDTILYFGAILALCFLFNKKFYNMLVFLVSVLIGLLPRLILDQKLFGFPFYTAIKTFVSGFVNIFGATALSSGGSSFSLANVLPFLLTIPIVFWVLYSPDLFKENKKTMIFLSLSILLLLLNPQIRYLLVLVPIMIVLIILNLNEKAWKIQSIYSIIVTIIFILPIILQVPYTINNEVYGADISLILSSGLHLSSESLSEQIVADIKEISNEFPDSVFLVGNSADSYQTLAHFYFRDKVKEFVSIQDYSLFLSNSSELFEKKIVLTPKISDRRQIWIAGGIEKSVNDNTDYSTIELGIGLGEPIQQEGFVLYKSYSYLYLSKKTVNTSA